jgi:hypothetical protein
VGRLGFRDTQSVCSTCNITYQHIGSSPNQLMTSLVVEIENFTKASPRELRTASLGKRNSLTSFPITYLLTHSMEQSPS